MRELSLAGSPGGSWRTGQYTASEAAILYERAITGRLSREELEDRSVYSLRGCHTAFGMVSREELEDRSVCRIRGCYAEIYRDYPRPPSFWCCARYTLTGHRETLTQYITFKRGGGGAGKFVLLYSVVFQL